MYFQPTRIRLYASRHHHRPANNSRTISHKIRLSVSASPPAPPLSPTKLGFLSLPLLPLISFQQNISMVVHSASIEDHYLQQIHGQALGKNHNPSSAVCLHTPAPPLPHPQFLPFSNSQLMSPTHNLMISLPHRFYTPISWL